MLKTMILVKWNKRLRRLKVIWLILKSKSIKPSNQSSWLHHQWFSSQLHTNLQSKFQRQLFQTVHKKNWTNWNSKPTIKKVHTRMSSKRSLITWEKECHSWSTKKLKRECKSTWRSWEKKLREISKNSTSKTRNILNITKRLTSQGISKSNKSWLGRSKKNIQEKCNKNMKITPKDKKQ